MVVKLVVAVKTRIEYTFNGNYNCLREGDLQVTEEVLMKSKYNKHVEGDWRMSLE